MTRFGGGAIVGDDRTISRPRDHRDGLPCRGVDVRLRYPRQAGAVTRNRGPAGRGVQSLASAGKPFR